MFAEYIFILRCFSKWIFIFHAADLTSLNSNSPPLREHHLPLLLQLKDNNQGSSRLNPHNTL